VDGDIAGNSAVNSAAIEADDGAEVVIERGSGTDCRSFDSPPGSVPCSRIRDNVSDNAFMIYLSGNDATHRISQTFIHGNETNAGLFSALIRIDSAESGVPSRLDIEGSVIHDNRTNFILFEVWDEHELHLLWSTVADNDLGESPYSVFDSNLSTGEEYGQRLTYGSIVYQPGIPVARDDGADSFFFFCNIAHDVNFPGQTSQSQAADPMFVDAGADNYHIDPDSPAVDFCLEGSWPPEDPDMDGEMRGVSQTGASASYDVGADEALDRLFADRFID
jgi:hypothetical protein